MVRRRPSHHQSIFLFLAVLESRRPMRTHLLSARTNKRGPERDDLDFEKRLPSTKTTLTFPSEGV